MPLACTFNNILNIHTISITININKLITTDISKMRKIKLHKRVYQKRVYQKLHIPETTYTLMIIHKLLYVRAYQKKEKK